MGNQDSMHRLREGIDRINDSILALLTQRAGIAREIAELKKQVPGETVYYKPEREAEVLRKVLAANTGPLSNAAVARVFREIMSACLALEKELGVAYLGPPGTYSHEAVHRHFGGSVNLRPQPSIAEVFREVEQGKADYGMVPVENSTEGAVTHSMDLFLTRKVKVCGESTLPIHHNLLTLASRLRDIRKVYSHQQSLGQCRGWLGRYLPGVDQQAVSSNSEAARLAVEEPQSAAIAGSMAASLYGLNILETNIEDEVDNATRFLVIGHQLTEPSGVDKTSLVLSTGNRPGALVDLLEPFSRHGISMTRIESRPNRKGRWEYVFFIDIEGHRLDPKVAIALDEVSDLAIELHVLGSYPKAVSPDGA